MSSGAALISSRASPLAIAQVCGESSDVVHAYGRDPTWP
jgi:hypothetical protein